MVDVTDIEHHRLAIRIFCNRKHRVRRLALIIPIESPTDSHRASRMHLVIINGPGGNIQLVRSLIIQVTVPASPEPVPVIVNQVVMILVNYGRAFPKIPIKIRWWITGRLESDAVTWLAAVTIRNFEPWELAAFKGFMEPCDSRVAATLGAVLHDHAVLLLSLNSDTTFCDVVAHWFFDIHMLASLSPPDGHQRMPMVRSSNRDSIDILIFQNTSNVFVT